MARLRVGAGRRVKRTRLAAAVASATLGTGLLVAAFVLVTRSEAPPLGVLAWGLAALLAVFAFLARYRPETFGEAVREGLLVALGQAVALHGVQWAFGASGASSSALLSFVRHALAFALLDVATLATATLLGRWFPQQRPGARR
jgi:hypothetical protein